LTTSLDGLVPPKDEQAPTDAIADASTRPDAS